MKKKTAVVFGTFAPLHQGHIDLIQRAKRQCDQVWVVVSGYEGDRGTQGLYRKSKGGFYPYLCYFASLPCEVLPCSVVF